LLEAEEAGEKARPPLLLGQREKRFQRVDHPGAELAEGLDGQHAGLPIRVALRQQQGALRLRISQHTQTERRRPAHGGRLIDQQPFENGPPRPVRNPTQGHGEILTQRRVPLEALLDGEVVIRLAIHQKEEESPLLDMGYLKIRRLPRRTGGGVRGTGGKEEEEEDRGKLSSGHGVGDATTGWTLNPWQPLPALRLNRPSTPPAPPPPAPEPPPASSPAP